MHLMISINTYNKLLADIYSRYLGYFERMFFFFEFVCNSRLTWNVTFLNI